MQQSPKERVWLLPVLALCVFGVITALLLRVVPGPHTELDYVVIGTVSIMIALLAVFIVWTKAGRPTGMHVRDSAPKQETRASGSMSILGDLSGDKA